MANELTTQNANLVRQKTYMMNRNPGVFYGLKSLFLHLAANRSNPDLQLVNIDGTFSSSDGGNNASQVMINGASTLYGLYLVKSGTVATFFKLTNHASVATTDGTQDIGYKITTSGEEDLWLFPSGRAFGTGITVTENTTATGSVLTLKANRLDGFIIVAA